MKFMHHWRVPYNTYLLAYYITNFILTIPFYLFVKTLLERSMTINVDYSLLL